MVPVKNLAKQVVVTHECWPIKYGYDDGSGLIVCGEPKFNVPDYFVVVEQSFFEKWESIIKSSSLATKEKGR